MNVLYILVRTDMPSMGYGKGAAQSAHASNVFMFNEMVMPLLAQKIFDAINPDVWEWSQQAVPYIGYGTTITKDVGKKKALNAVIEAAKKMGYSAETVTDQSYPYIVDREIFGLLPESLHTLPPIFKGDQVICHRREVTCGYIFGDSDALHPLMSMFPLLRND